MADIFALQGLSNAGKSSTLIELRKQINTKYRPNSTETVLHLSTRINDVKVIIDLPDGTRIGLESKGDNPAPLKKSLDDFRNLHCDLVFCACRPGGGTGPLIISRAPPDIVHPFIQQTATSGGIAAERRENRKQARRLMQLAGI